jgi:hypothetical protein
MLSHSLRLLIPILLLGGCVATAFNPVVDNSRQPLPSAASSAPALSQIKERVVPAPLTEEELHLAKVAWKYFENNTQPTGLANAVEGYPSTTLWDTASYMGGLMAAYELGLIDKAEFNQRTAKLLGALNRMELFQKELPNKGYNTQTLEKVDYANQPGDIGYSAVDIGRMLIWLKIFKERYPQHASAIDNYVLKWDFSELLDEWGTMYGKIPGPDGNFILVQEGRMGYEEYAAKGFRLWGFNTERASKFEPYDVILMHGIEIPYDSRDPRKYVSHNFVVVENYTVDKIELGWDQPEDRDSAEDVYTDPQMAEFARRIFAVQEARYRETGILTARTEHQLDQPPYFVYDTIFSDGFPWNTIDPSSNYQPDFAAVALKGAFSMWAVWDMPYADILMQTVGSMYDPDKGFYEGIYENGNGPINIFTANNNGIILESLLYKAQGKLLRFNPEPVPSLWDKTIAECPPEARQRAQCLRK